MYWWEELSDGELRARLVNRGTESDLARGMVQHARSGCRFCIADIRKLLQ